MLQLPMQRQVEREEGDRCNIWLQIVRLFDPTVNEEFLHLPHCRMLLLDHTLTERNWTSALLRVLCA